MAEEKKKLNVFGAVSDLLIFVLFVGGAGFFGYFVGINQRLAPVQIVAPGTIDAMKYIAQQATGNKIDYSSLDPSQKPSVAPPGAEIKPPATPASTPETKVESEKPSKTEDAKKEDKNKKAKDAKKTSSLPPSSNKKFFLASSGNEYVGSSVTVSVNSHPVDQFFGPGKYVDVTNKVKKGSNELTFDSHVLPDEYNQHLGDNSFSLTLQLVSGDQIKGNFQPSDVMLTYKRTAADIEDGHNKMNFQVK